ncbi:MAG: indole-3-glycerol phosphate synthase TrpC [Candidatus Moranbacteria bacterium]|nr:indole-3-glycerol phosphate synthase TrpC [Candidatus Moranbacteria bacterium]
MRFKKTNTILDEICQNKAKQLGLKLENQGLEKLKKQIRDSAFKPSSFKKALQKPGISLIAEIKKSSPAMEGENIRKNFDLERIAKIYEKSKARAISVVTEEKYFSSDPQYLKTVKSLVGIPVLRKDFLIDEYQIYESKAMGADAVLMIASILQKAQIKKLYHLARNLELDVLVEAHNKEEVRVILNTIEPDIIGINNRDLKTMKIDLANFESLVERIPKNVLKVAESGIESGKDVSRMQRAGADGVLVGTSLMKAQDIEAKIKELI